MDFFLEHPGHGHNYNKIRDLFKLKLYAIRSETKTSTNVINSNSSMNSLGFLNEFREISQ